MPITVSHGLSATTPDDPAYEIRPSHWNDTHAATLSIAASEISGLFSNANGVSFGSSNGAITASVQTNYLTTAMASNRGSDFVQATAGFAGTSASGTVASNGISVSIGPYITTGMLSNAATISNIRLSAGTTSNLASAFTIADSNGISFGLNGGTLTATVKTDYQTAGAYLTTAALSNHSHGNPTLALTNLTGTTASASNGFTLSLSGNAAGGGDAIRGIAANGSTASTNTVNFSNSNGISFGFGAAGNSTVLTASHNALTTARASNDAVGLNTALTANGVALTVNSSGLSLNIPAFLTTAAQSDHSHGNPTLALTNLSGTTASASNGFTLSLAAAAPSGAATHSYYPILGVGYVQGTTAISTPGASTNLVQPFFLPQAVSLSYIRIPMSVGKANTGGATTAARSWSLAQFDTYFANFYSLGVGANSRSLQYVTGSSVGVTFSNVYQIGAASNNQSCSYSASIPTEGATTQYTTSFGVASASFTFHTTILSNSIVGNKWLDVPMEVSLSAGAWWIAIQRSSTTGSTTAGGNFAGLTNITSRASLYAASQVNVPVLPWGVNTSASTGAAWQVGLGAWTTNTNGRTTASMALSNIVSVANQPVFPINLVRQA